MVANYNSATAILRLHPQKLYHLLLLNVFNHRLFTEGDAAIDNQYVHLNKENLRAESSTGSVGRATFCVPFLLRENATRRFHHKFRIHRSLMGKTEPPMGNRTLGKGSSLSLPVNSLVENIIEPSNDYPFVAVEFDTYRNSGPTVKDPDGNHVGIGINCLKSNITRAWNGGILEAKLNRAWISYNSSLKNLSVAFTTFNNDTQEQKISYPSYMVDLSKYLPDWVIVGFSASTGVASALHTLISWNFTSTVLFDNKVLALSGQEKIIFETPVPHPRLSSKLKARKCKKPLAVVIGSSISGFILVCFLGLGLYNSCKKKATRTTDGNPNDLIHEFERELPEEVSIQGVDIKVPKYGRIDTYAPQLQTISRCLASGLLYLHEILQQPLLHMNIKSSNVMVDSDFNAKLGDFGFSNRKEPQMITTSYIAPEYIDTRQLSKKSDVFSFGIVALQISCGRKLIDPKFGGSQVNMVE
ncbi:hypothetical protein L3X38_023278 [Prunus dulcis]|uniref:non-specific serine/threonine protein kinase n=1 Tax=Prunus dulcis TaxID=3755 RepID=A0AAD4VYP6_PRUDU|nr:hypothetical protein L3X38_023278 [Prunus dulcis]